MKKLSILFLTMLLILSMLFLVACDSGAVTPKEEEQSEEEGSTEQEGSTESTDSSDPADPSDPSEETASEEEQAVEEEITLCINEVCSKNKGGQAAQNGEYYDWIELYNATDETLSIAGWRLSNTDKAKGKFVFPEGTTLAPHAFLLLYAVGNEEVVSEGDCLLPFKISADGEELYLRNPDGVLVERISVPGLHSKTGEVSYARITDGGEVWATAQTTPCMTNAGSVSLLSKSTLTFSHESGFYDEDFDLTLTLPEGYSVKYTTDSTEPLTSKSAITWSGETIHIYDYSEEANRFTDYNMEWSPDLVDKCFVLRCVILDDDGHQSLTITKTYFIDYANKETVNNIRVMTLTSEPSGLFSTEGGLFVLNDGETSWGDQVHNGSEWERQTNMNLFDTDGTLLFSQDVGIRIRGTSTRGAAQKSLNIFARSSYDGNSSFPDSMFGNGIVTKSIAIRAESAGAGQIGQGYIQDLVEDRDIVTLDNFPCVVFIDGEYFGMYTVYERFDEDYVEGHYGVDADNVYIAKKMLGSWGAEFKAPDAEEGDEAWLACQDAFYDIFAFIGANDLSDPDNYAYVESLIDMDSLIDLICIQLYIENVDFSMAQNISCWRSIEIDPSNPYADGRWRFVLYDLDIAVYWGSNYNYESDPFTEKQPYAGAGFLGWTSSTNYFTYVNGKKTARKDKKSNLRYALTTKLLTSTKFVDEFTTRFMDIGNVNFDYETRVLPLMKSIYEEYYEQNAPATAKRYNENYKDMDSALIRSKFKEVYKKYTQFYFYRPYFIYDYLASAFSLTGVKSTVRVCCEGVENVTIDWNTTQLDLTVDTRKLIYYSDCALTIEAPAIEGKTFVGWEIDGCKIITGTSQDPKVCILLEDSSAYITAVYE